MSALALAPIIASSVASLLGNKFTNDANAREAEKQRDWQEDLSNTAYQRAMVDMRAAGLNPILAGKLGGSVTPTGAMANVANYGSAFTQGLSSGATAYQTDSNVEKQNAEIKQIEAQVFKIRQEIATSSSQAWLNSSAARLNESQIGQISETIYKIRAEARERSASALGIEADNVQRQIMADFYNSAEFVKVAKDIGVSPGLLKTIYQMFFNRGQTAGKVK